jgi:predicted RNA methylase
MYDMPGFPFPNFDVYTFRADEYGMSGSDFNISWLASQEGELYRKGLALAKKNWAGGDDEPAAAPLSPALEVIRRSTITSSSVTLPAGHIGELYKEVKKYLKAAGGKWNTKAGAFLFTRDPREQLAAALSTGKVVSTKKATQAFYTPAPVIDRVLSYLPADLTELSFLEPEAGEGAIADAIKARGGSVICAEIDPHSVGELQAKGYTTHAGDFLAMEPSCWLPVDAVVMNPPFTKGQDIKHVTHALKFLKPGGTLLAIMSPSFTFASNKAAQAFNELVQQRGSIVEEFAAGAFKESGTMVRTVLVKLTK